MQGLLLEALVAERLEDLERRTVAMGLRGKVSRRRNPSRKER
jgi:hypothetical protein